MFNQQIFCRTPKMSRIFMQILNIYFQSVMPIWTDFIDSIYYWHLFPLGIWCANFKNNLKCYLTYTDVYKSLGLDNQLPRTEYEYGSGADILWILALAKNDGNSSRSPSLFEKLNHRPSETDDAELCSFYSQLLETERAISPECCNLSHYSGCH